MKIYQMRKRINNPMASRNAMGWKYPFYEATVDGKALKSVMINPNSDAKGVGRAFSWGYKGIYPLNLSLSILCDFFDMDDYAELFAESGYNYAANKFYKMVVRDNKKDSWKITEKQIYKFMDKCVKEIDNGTYVTI